LNLGVALRHQKMKIAYFLTGHGFGHGVRGSAIISELPPEIEVDIYTSLPEAFFREELHRPYQYISCEIDCGCLQLDTVEVDVEATLARYSEIEADRHQIISRYVPMLKATGVDLVIGDTPPLAFPIAKAAGIASWNLCNFDWTDIYRPFVEQHPRYQEMLERMTADYALADRNIRFFPFMEPPSGAPFEKIGLVCRPGRPSREAFAKRFGLDIQKKWCLIYIGNFGLEGVAWDRLNLFPDWEFMGLYPLSGAAANYHQVDKDPSFRYADLTASVDLVLGKLGYGLVAECLSLAKPILFLSRNGFSEYDMLRQLILDRNMGQEISLEKLMSLDIESELNSLPFQALQPMQVTGIAEILKKMGISP
jgi:hypothetical protein